MTRSVLLILSLALISSLAAGQTSTYGPPGISTTIPTAAPAAPPVITPSANAIPTSPSVNAIPITPPVVTIPITPAVAPPIEPDPTTRMNNTLTMYASRPAPEVRANGSFFDLGVNDAAGKVDDGSQGRSLGEVAREKRQCTPNVAGHTFSNDDFERTPGADGASGLPKVVVTVCPAEKQP